MKVFMASDIHYCYINNRIYVTEKVSRIFSRYFESFGKLVLCTRIRNEQSQAKLIDITDMIDDAIPFKSFGMLYSPKYEKKMKDVMQKCDLVVGRFESFSAIRAYEIAKKINKPFFGEVMSDPWDGLWNHGIKGKIVAPYSYLKTKQALANADYGLYVTSEFLQHRYPCNRRTVAASNVYINDSSNEVIDKRLKRINQMDLTNISLMTTGATYVRYKGQEYVIKAIPKLNKKGINVKYYIVGEGSQEYLKNVAKKNHVENQVIFTGRLPLDKVLNKLDDVDLYIQPSLQEGLPRSVIEAMSRGCPCIGARTAGIPELIQAECVFKRKSSVAIAETILNVLEREKLKSYSMQNYNNSKNYLDNVLNQKRCDYYKYVVQDLKR